MPSREEAQDLQKTIARLEQAIGVNRAKILTLSPKVDAAKADEDRCAHLRDLCKENLLYLKKGDVVTMKDYEEMLDLYRTNKELVVKHRNDVYLFTKLMKSAEDEVVSLEQLLDSARKQAKKTAVVVPFTR